jgi:alpha-ketoglutarate-dependent taurine dioxygenase
LAIEEIPGGDLTLPLIIRPARPEVDLVAFGQLEREEIRRKLLRHGGILFRGFGHDGPARFAEFVRVVSDEPLAYAEQTSPRSVVDGNVYTSTEHPADQTIPLHCENSYRHRWPRKIFFFCERAPDVGGETPIADVRQVLSRIPAAVRERFEAEGVMYLRNFGLGAGLSWQTAFGVESRAEVEAYCREAGIAFEWSEPDRLTTRQVRQAVACHPETGERSWFNHAAFFHISTLEPELRLTLLRSFGEEFLPYNTYYGDGSAIDDDSVGQIRRAYEECTITLPWQTGDLLMLDNMLAAHGRMPYTGPRRVLVAMSESS